MKTIPNDESYKAQVTHWHHILSMLHQKLPLIGVSEQDVTLTGYPIRMTIGKWGEWSFRLGAKGAHAVFQYRTLGANSYTVSLEQADEEVVADMACGLEVALGRRRQVENEDKHIQYEEMKEMLAETGWFGDGSVWGARMLASFRHANDQVRGTLYRTESSCRDPADAMFSINLQLDGMDYARAMAVLVELRSAADKADPYDQLSGFDEEYFNSENTSGTAACR